MLLAANLSMIYAHLPVEQRFAAAARDGFRYVEILQPYDMSPAWYARQLADHGLQLVLINTPTVQPDYPMGVAAQPDAIAEFQKAMDTAAAVCQETGCSAVHVMAGKNDASHSREAQSAALRENLRWACERHPGLVLQLEALNATDVPDYYYSRPEQVAAELEALTGSRVAMQFDFYHVVKEQLHLSDELRRCFPSVAHIQIAGAPQRAEPRLEQDGLMQGLEQLHEAGYQGYIGLEYRPAAFTPLGAPALDWLSPLLERKLVHFSRADRPDV